MVAQACGNTRSCLSAIKCYQNYQCNNILLSCFIASRLFVCEGEDVLVACSCEEKDVLVVCLFWRTLPQWRAITHKTIIFDQTSANDHKYFIMRECEHIGDTRIWSQEGIYIFLNIWKVFGDLFQRSHSFAFFLCNSKHLNTWLPTIGNVLLWY